MNISLSNWELHTKIPSQLGRSDHFLHRLLAAHTYPALSRELASELATEAGLHTFTSGEHSSSTCCGCEKS